MMCVDLQPANQIHELSSTAAACPCLRFDQTHTRSDTGNQTCHSETQSFSSHGWVRVEIPSYLKNADPFCSARVHLPLWDARTHRWLTVWLCVCVCVCFKNHAHHLAAATFIKTERERKTDQSLCYATCILSMKHSRSVAANRNKLNTALDRLSRYRVRTWNVKGNIIR